MAAHRDRLRAATTHAEVALQGEAWTHSDVRGDNVVVDGERAWIVDWNWLSRGPEWSDLALLLPMVHADGVDLAAAYDWRLLADVPADDLDAAVAWLGALMLRFADDPVFRRRLAVAASAPALDRPRLPPAAARPLGVSRPAPVAR